MCYADLLTISSVSAQSGEESHCVAELTPVKTQFDPQQGTKESSEVISYDCFDTFSEAINFATNGNVQVNESMSLSQVVEDINEYGVTARSGVLPRGILWDNTSYTGSSFTINGSQPCSASITYYQSIFPGSIFTSFAGKAESGQTLNGCSTMYVYSGSAFSGQWGFFNNAASTFSSLPPFGINFNNNVQSAVVQ